MVTKPIRRASFVLAVLTTVSALLTGCGSQSTHSAPWVLAHADSSSDVVAVTYFHGTCDSLRSVRTVSSSTTVTFRIKVHDPSGACNAMLVGTSIRIRMDANLGSRRVTGACRPGHPPECGEAPVLASLDMSKLPIYGP